MGMDAGTPTITTVPAPAGRAPAPCFCSPGWGVSPCQHPEVTAWPWLPGGGLGWCWAGLGPHLTGSWGERGELGTRSRTHGPCWQRPACAASLGGERGRAEGAHLQGDGECWLCRNSVLSSARSPGPGGPLPSLRHTCSSCCVVGIRATSGASSCTGPGAPRLPGSCRDSLYSSEKLLGRRGSFSQEHPVPSTCTPSPPPLSRLTSGRALHSPSQGEMLAWHRPCSQT